MSFVHRSGRRDTGVYLLRQVMAAHTSLGPQAPTLAHGGGIGRLDTASARSVTAWPEYVPRAPPRAPDRRPAEAAAATQVKPRACISCGLLRCAPGFVLSDRARSRVGHQEGEPSAATLEELLALHRRAATAATALGSSAANDMEGGMPHAPFLCHPSMRLICLNGDR